MTAQPTLLVFVALATSLAPACAGGADITGGEEDTRATVAMAATLTPDHESGSESTATTATTAEGSSSPAPDPTGSASTGSTGSTSGEHVPATSSGTTGAEATSSMEEDLSYCGDGVVDPGELCDDGNQIDDDTCTVQCIPYYCGDGVIDEGYLEECDDGNLIGTDGCTTACKVAKCGDGYVQAGVEECDDGNTSNYDICLSNCTIAKCGDGYLWKYDLPQGQKAEQCDDGVTNGPCPSPCSVTCEYNFPDC